MPVLSAGLGLVDPLLQYTELQLRVLILCLSLLSRACFLREGTTTFSRRYTKVSDTTVLGESTDSDSGLFLARTRPQEPGPASVRRVGSRKRLWTRPSRITSRITLEKVRVT